MRWFWVDRFIEFVPGKLARSVKNVSLSEEHMHDHFPGYPLMPHSLMLEGMAQTGGILLGQTHNFSSLIFLAKVPKVAYHEHVRPGDQIIYTATLEDAREEGGVTNVQAHVGDKLVAEAQIVFAQLSPDEAGIPKNISQRNVVESALAQVMEGIVK